MTYKLNLLLISSKSANYGGVEYHCLDLIKCFSKKYNVTIMCPVGELCSEYKKNGANVINKVPGFPYDFIFAFYVFKFCKKHKVNVVHAHELISAQGMFGAFLAGVPKRIWHVHTPFLMWKNQNIVQDILKKTFNFITNFFVANFFSTDVIALNQDIAKYRKYREIIFNKIHVVPNGIDFRKYSTRIEKEAINTYKIQNKIPTNKIIIGNISRTSAEKGQIYLCKAFKLFNQKYPNKYYLLIGGGGELEDDLRKYCRKNFPNNFLITGKFNDKDKLTILQAIDYFVFPSIAEGFGYAPIEAIYSGIPVISSDINVLRTVLEDSVYYFKSQNSSDLLQKLEELTSLDSITNQKKLEQGIKILNKYSLEAFCENYLKIYEQ